MSETISTLYADIIVAAKTHDRTRLCRIRDEHCTLSPEKPIDIALGHNTTLKDYSSSPIFELAYHGDTAAVLLLLEMGASLPEALEGALLHHDTKLVERIKVNPRARGRERDIKDTHLYVSAMRGELDIKSDLAKLDDPHDIATLVYGALIAHQDVLADALIVKLYENFNIETHGNTHFLISLVAASNRLDRLETFLAREWLNAESSDINQIASSLGLAITFDAKLYERLAEFFKTHFESFDVVGYWRHCLIEGYLSYNTQLFECARKHLEQLAPEESIEALMKENRQFRRQPIERITFFRKHLNPGFKLKEPEMLFDICHYFFFGLNREFELLDIIIEQSQIPQHTLQAVYATLCRETVLGRDLFLKHLDCPFDMPRFKMLLERADANYMAVYDAANRMDLERIQELQHKLDSEARRKIIIREGETPITRLVSAVFPLARQGNTEGILLLLAHGLQAERAILDCAYAGLFSFAREIYLSEACVQGYIRHPSTRLLNIYAYCAGLHAAYREIAWCTLQDPENLRFALLGAVEGHHTTLVERLLRRAKQSEIRLDYAELTRSAARAGNFAWLGRFEASVINPDDAYIISIFEAFAEQGNDTLMLRYLQQQLPKRIMKPSCHVLLESAILSCVHYLNADCLTILAKIHSALTFVDEHRAGDRSKTAHHIHALIEQSQHDLEHPFRSVKKSKPPKDSHTLLRQLIEANNEASFEALLNSYRDFLNESVIESLYFVAAPKRMCFLEQCLGRMPQFSIAHANQHLPGYGLVELSPYRLERIMPFLNNKEIIFNDMRASTWCDVRLSIEIMTKLIRALKDNLHAQSLQMQFQDPHHFDRRAFHALKEALSINATIIELSFEKLTEMTYVKHDFYKLIELVQENQQVQSFMQRCRDMDLIEAVRFSIHCRRNPNVAGKVLHHEARRLCLVPSESNLRDAIRLAETMPREMRPTLEMALVDVLESARIQLALLLLESPDPERINEAYLLFKSFLTRPQSIRFFDVVSLLHEFVYSEITLIDNTLRHNPTLPTAEFRAILLHKRDLIIELADFAIASREPADRVRQLLKEADDLAILERGDFSQYKAHTEQSDSTGMNFIKQPNTDRRRTH